MLLAAASASAPPRPVPLVVLRSTGHSGSRWLAELLSSQNLSFFFEFAGRCPERYPLANASLRDIFRSGCRCKLDAAMDEACPSDSTGHIRSATCSKDALCAGRCPDRNPSGCLAVGMVDTYSEPLARRLQEHRASGEAVSVVTFERDNSVKHAISKLKASCTGTRLKKNHAHRPLADADAAPRAFAPLGQPSPPPPPLPAPLSSLLHVQPDLLALEALDAARGRRMMQAGVHALLGEAQYALHYEDLQASTTAVLRKMLGAVGVPRFEPSLLERSLLVKGAAESLTASLLNYDEIDAALANASCVRAMLRSAAPRRFDASCGAAWDGVLGAHYAKQPVDAATFYCVHQPHQPLAAAAAAHHRSEKPATPAAAAAASTAAHERSLASGAGHGTHRDALPRGITTCEPIGVRGYDDDDDERERHRKRRRRGGAEAPPACTPVEERLCEAAVTHVYWQTGALGTELCTLRRPQGAMELLPQLRPRPRVEARSGGAPSRDSDSSLD